MVGRPGAYQFSCNAGELAPELLGNTGLKQYYAGLKRAENVEPVPQGGFDLLPRSRYRATVNAAAAKILPFSVSRDAAYVVVLAPLTLTIFKAGVSVATLAHPFTAAQIETLKSVQRAETMLLFHPDVPTQKLLRHGSDAAWTIAAGSFDNVPAVDLGGAYATVPEVWSFYMAWASTPTGHAFVASVNGDETTAVSLDASWAVTAGALKAALEALPEVEAGIAVDVVTTSTTAATLRVTFSGGRNAGARFALSGHFVTTPNISLNTWRETIGEPGGEAIVSPARGYPASGRFYQDRLFQGGFKAKPSAFLASRTGEYFDLNIKLANAAGGILDNIDTEGDEEIVDIRQSKHLVIFTTEADYYVSNRTIDRTQPLNVVRSSKYGCSRRVPVVEQEGSLLYINRDETILYAATYNDVAQAYVSEPVSLLSSHLVAQMRDAALQAASDATDSQRYWLVRDDGLVVVGLFIRNQDVAGFVRWTTDGLPRACAVDGDNVVHMLVDRTVNGATQRLYETLEEGLLLDAAQSFTFDTPAAHVTGLGIHEGRKVWAIADGFVEGPYTVVGGAIDLRFPAAAVTVGRWSAPKIETVPLVRDVAPHTVLKRPGRIFQVVLDLIETDSVAVGANDRPPKAVTLYRAGEATDMPLAPVTGAATVSGLAGFVADPTVVITQTKPGRLQVRDITVQAKL